MNVNFPLRLQQAVEAAAAEQERLRQEHNSQHEHVKVLTNYRDTPELCTPSIRPTGWNTDQPGWEVWIPPHKDAHFDGDNIVGPFGTTYFDTLDEASNFLANTLVWIEDGEPPFEMEDLGPVAIESVVLLTKDGATPLPAEGNVYHADEWGIGFDEESDSEAWWIEVELGRNDEDTAELRAEQVLSLSDTEAAALAFALFEAIGIGRMKYSRSTEEEVA